MLTTLRLQALKPQVPSNFHQIPFLHPAHTPTQGMYILVLHVRIFSGNTNLTLNSDRSSLCRQVATGFSRGRAMRATDWHPLVHPLVSPRPFLVASAIHTFGVSRETAPSRSLPGQPRRQPVIAPMRLRPSRRPLVCCWLLLTHLLLRMRLTGLIRASTISWPIRGPGTPFLRRRWIMLVR